MANSTKFDIVLWENIAAKKIQVPDEVWAYWDNHFTQIFEKLEVKINSYSQKEIPISEGFWIVDQVIILAGALRRVVASLDDGSYLDKAQDEERIILETNVKKLMNHHLGNDLLKISGTVENCITGPGAGPVPADLIKTLLSATGQIKDFLFKLKSQTRG
ncbi:MAG: hypothetical protein HQL23_07390 [Candidatus Omnitrophica bacterium]|nr:hypothetical protein [Candidatus Omnitrophota bacterium]